MTGAMPLTRARSSAIWAGNRRRVLKPESAKPCNGIWTIWNGLRVSPVVNTRSGSTPITAIGERHERHYSGGRIGDALVSGDSGCFQATAADLRQTNDLLPAIHADAGGYQGFSGHLYPAGYSPVRV